MLAWNVNSEYINAWASFWVVFWDVNGEVNYKVYIILERELAIFSF